LFLKIFYLLTVDFLGKYMGIILVPKRTVWQVSNYCGQCAGSAWRLIVPSINQLISSPMRQASKFARNDTTTIYFHNVI